MRIYVETTPELSRVLQELAFKCGRRWPIGGVKVQYVNEIEMGLGLGLKSGRYNSNFIYRQKQECGQYSVRVSLEDFISVLKGEKTVEELCKHKVVIDGKEIELSQESYLNLKEHFLRDD